MKISVCCMVLAAGHDELIVALECKKGRGIILPGGKYESTDTSFESVARRELLEETGLKVRQDAKITCVLQAPDPTGFFCFCYTIYPDELVDNGGQNFANNWQMTHLRETGEGRPIIVHKNQLLADRNCIFYPYYHLLLRGT